MVHVAKTEEEHVQYPLHDVLIFLRHVLMVSGDHGYSEDVYYLFEIQPIYFLQQ